MTDKRTRHLPVLDNKKVVGLISIGDVVNKIIIDQKNTIQYLEDYIIRG
jgi:CBS domain-containing protein